MGYGLVGVGRWVYYRPPKYREKMSTKTRQNRPKTTIKHEKTMKTYHKPPAVAFSGARRGARSIAAPSLVRRGSLGNLLVAFGRRRRSPAATSSLARSIAPSLARRRS